MKNMDMDTLEKSLEWMKKNGVRRLKINDVELELGSVPAAAPRLSDAEIKELEKFYGRVPTDEELLMDPYAGMNGRKLKSQEDMANG